MLLLLHGPLWFRGIDAVSSVLFSLVTLLVAVLSTKAYALTEEKKYRYFSLAFYLMSVAFASVGIIKLLLIFHLSTTLSNVLWTFDFMFLLYILLMVIAYGVLLILSFKVRDKDLVTLLLVLALLFVLFSYQHFLKFHIVSFVLLAFVTSQFYRNYVEKKNKNARLVFASFYLLTAAEGFLIVHTYFYVDGLFFIIGNLLQLCGYLALGYMLLRVRHHDREKRTS